MESFFYAISKLFITLKVINTIKMLEVLLRKLFIKLEEEPTNDKKSKNGCAVYFTEQVLEGRFKKFNLISVRGLKDYYDKYVNGKENSSGEPSTELKNLISQYLGYEGFLDFEHSIKVSTTGLPKTKDISIDNIKKWVVPTVLFIPLFLGLYLYGFFEREDCIVWKVDHYEKIDCTNRAENISINTIDIERFKKIKIDSTTLFFKNNKAIVWYGKLSNGNVDFFTSRGTHPVTGKELKPVTPYIIDKYIGKAAK